MCPRPSVARRWRERRAAHSGGLIVSVMYVLVPTALLLVVVAIAAYVWAARRGQFDDLDTPAVRALHDDEPAPGEPGSSAKR